MVAATTPSCRTLAASVERAVRKAMFDLHLRQRGKTCKAVRAGKLLIKKEEFMTPNGNLEKKWGLTPKSELVGVMEQNPSKKTKLMSETGADVKF